MGLFLNQIMGELIIKDSLKNNIVIEKL
jgi:hypothetical protein